MNQYNEASYIPDRQKFVRQNDCMPLSWRSQREKKILQAKNPTGYTEIAVNDAQIKFRTTLLYIDRWGMSTA